MLSKKASIVFGLLFMGAATLQLEVSAEVDFNRDIRPILSDRCFFCHGPDSETREADLRLDMKESAEEVLQSGELLRRITSDDPDEQMPPVETNLSVSKQEVEKIRSWIEQGAPYELHWSFSSLPHSVRVPEVQAADWPKNPIDNFVLAQLETQGIEPSVEASPTRWLRRVTLALNGLPPKVVEVQEFQKAVQQRGEKAYEQAIDRLLASSAYGEHMAVCWLDAARYADSYGYQSDLLNSQWPYRDWVVRAFNANLSYDKFITYQLAGDLLPDPNRDQILATAFNRLHRLTNEGGAVPEEWRLENVADRVHTFGTALLGLTLECARCHDHKFDPITSEDYYSISAFFNSIDEDGLYDSTAKVPPPTLNLPTPEQAEKLSAAQREVETAEAELEAQIQSAPTRIAKWLRTIQSPLTVPNKAFEFAFDRDLTNESESEFYSSTDNRQKTGPLKQVAVVDSAFPRLDSHSDSRRAVSFDGERGITVKDTEPIDRWTPFSLVCTLRETKRNTLRSIIAHDTQGTDAGFNGWDLSIENGHVEARLYRAWPGNGIGVRTVHPIPVDEWVQLSATYDGSSRAEGLRLFLNGQPLETEVLRNSIFKSASQFSDDSGGLVLGQRFRSRGFTNGLIDDVRFYRRELSATELDHLASGEPVRPELAYYVSAIDEECRSARAKLQQSRKALVAVEEEVLEVPVMEELADPLPAYVLARGKYDAPKNDDTLVRRNTFLEVLPRFPEDAPRNRLGLAQWATGPDHPLTSRVIVNRLWQEFFGAGLVRTPENFGLQGELPTHPKLLDWLSRDLIAHGWDLKRLCRSIALSATYRQDSAVTSKLLEEDPENRLISRGPAFRLSAEQIRDLTLAASGLMNKDMGGPPVAPYQAGGDLWKEANIMSPSYKQSLGQALYRRSLYSVWKRTAPLPNMMAFDASSREVCVVARSRTNTPLQALVLLNDVQFVEAARCLAVELFETTASGDERVELAFQTLTGREPDDRELATLTQLLAQEEEYYAGHKDMAKKLLALGQSEANDSLAPDKVAALAIVCQAIANSDATIWSR